MKQKHDYGYGKGKRKFYKERKVNKLTLYSLLDLEEYIKEVLDVNFTEYRYDHGLVTELKNLPDEQFVFKELE